MRAAGDMPVRPPDPARVGATVRSILAERQFQPPKRSIPQSIWHWITQQLGTLFGSLPGGQGGPAVPTWVVPLVLLLIVVGVATVIVRRAGRRREHRVRPEAVVHVRADDVGIGADAWVERAEAAEAAGDWRQGVRCRYRSIVARLARARVVSEEVGRTAGEYRRAVEADRPDLGPDFASATAVFEEVWYGQQAAGPPLSDELVARASSIDRALGRRPEPVGGGGR